MSTVNSAVLQSPKAVADTEIGLVLATANLAAPPERIFQALTVAKEIEEWWGSDDVYHMTNWVADTRPGGGYTVIVQNANGSALPASGRFLEVDAPYKLAHTRKYEWDFPILGRRDTTITYNLYPIEAGTRITVRHEGFAGCSQAALDHADGWERVLGWLEKYITNTIPVGL